MCCFTPDHTSKRHIPVIMARTTFGKGDGSRNFQCAGHADTVPAGTGFAKSPLGASNLCIGQRIIKPRFDNQIMSAHPYASSSSFCHPVISRS